MQRLQKRFTAQVEKEEEELKHSREEGPGTISLRFVCHKIRDSIVK